MMLYIYIQQRMMVQTSRVRVPALYNTCVTRKGGKERRELWMHVLILTRRQICREHLVPWRRYPRDVDEIVVQPGVPDALAVCHVHASAAADKTQLCPLDP